MEIPQRGSVGPCIAGAGAEADSHVAALPPGIQGVAAERQWGASGKAKLARQSGDDQRRRFESLLDGYGNASLRRRESGPCVRIQGQIEKGSFEFESEID